MHLHTFLTHSLKEAPLDLPTAYIVVDDTHAHPTPCLGDKGIGHKDTQGVVLEDIDIDMDMVAG